MNSLLRSVRLTIAVIAFTLCAPAHAQVEIAIGAVLVGKKVSQIINDLNLAGSQLIAQAGATGNGMISHAGNEANVLAKNVSFELRDRMDQTFERLDDAEKKLLIEVERTRQSLLEVVDKAYDAKDTMAVDLNRILDRFPFLSKGFFIQSVRGVAYFPGSSDYKMKVTASTLGIDEKVKTTVSVVVDDKPLEDASVDQSLQRGQAVITIPNSALSGKFNEREMVLVKAKLTFNVERQKGWGIFTRTVKEGPFEVPLTLALYPRIAATITPTSMAPTYAWVATGSMSQDLSTPNRHCHHCGRDTTGPNTIEIVVAGGNVPVVDYKRFVDPLSLSCISGGNVCGFSSAHRTSITNNGAKAVANWNTNSHPTTWRLTAPVETYTMTGEQAYAGPPQTALFGQALFFDFPKGSTVTALKVRTFTKNEYQILTGTADPKQILTYKGVEANPPPAVRRVLYQVEFPQGVQ